MGKTTARVLLIGGIALMWIINYIIWINWLGWSGLVLVTLFFVAYLLWIFWDKLTNAAFPSEETNE